MDSNTNELHKRSDAKIDSFSTELQELSHKIWQKPELAYEEHYAHEVLTDFLQSKGFKVERHYGGLKTGFKADNGSSKGPTVAILCEYDALPVVGHGCGHNLIAESGVAAGLGIKEALEGSTLGRVVVLGTPAEEGGGGKVDMIREGCFRDVDFCLMLHPAPFNVAFYKSQTMTEVVVTYHGKSAHAAASPYKAINALDAAVTAYNNISVLRQQIKPTWSVHGIFTDAGKKPNVIPDRAQLHFYVRCTNNRDTAIFKSKIQACFEGAALATGCTVDIDWLPNSFAAIETNSVLAHLYQKHAESFGETFESREEQEAVIDGSTDMGNVTLEVPGIHPLYCIEADIPYHSHEFRVSAGSQVAQEKTLNAAKAIARTVLDVLNNPQLLEDAKKEFNTMKQNYE